MLEGRPKRAKTTEEFRVEPLLVLLRDLSQKDPSPSLRRRLSDLSSQRLKNRLEFHRPLPGRQPRSFLWSRPVLATILLVVTITTAAYFVLLQQRKPLRASNPPPAGFVLPDVPSKERAQERPSVSIPEPPLPKVHPVRAKPVPDIKPRRLILRLPYSNSAVATGTNATIRVSMSQSELLSLGFPVNATLQDRRVMAELMLGDDGLPRAISLPLPLEVVKEKK